MADSVVSRDDASHPVLSICKLASGRTLKFPKAQPAGWATQAAFLTAMQAEHLGAINATQANGQNATALLTSLA